MEHIERQWIVSYDSPLSWIFLNLSLGLENVSIKDTDRGEGADWDDSWFLESSTIDKKLQTSMFDAFGQGILVSSLGYRVVLHLVE